MHIQPCVCICVCVWVCLSIGNNEVSRAPSKRPVTSHKNERRWSNNVADDTRQALVQESVTGYFYKGCCCAGLVSRRTVDWITSWLHCWWPTQRRAVKSVTWSSQVWEALMRAATGSTALSLETKLIPLFTPQNVFCCSNRLFFIISCIFETVWSKQHCLASSSSFLLIRKYSASSEWRQMFSFIFNLGSFLSILIYSLFI